MNHTVKNSYKIEYKNKKKLEFIDAQMFTGILLDVKGVEFDCTTVIH